MDQEKGCDFCAELATVTISRDLAGLKQTIRLCAACANKRGVNLADSVLPIATADLYEVLLDPAADSLDTKTCPKCGTAYREIRNTGLVGCVHCFDSFRAPIARLLPRIARQTNHAGSLPQSLHAYRRLFADRGDLQSRLDAALRAERYEDAAAIRDKLRAIEPGNP